jgi:K+-transporting ATPase KdpF subunit
VRSRGRRRLAAGQIVVVGLVAYLLTALLNADRLLDKAESMPFGSKGRSTALFFAKPLHRVARSLGFTKPGEAVDRWRQPDQGGTGEFANPGTTTTAPATGDSATPDDTAAPASDEQASTTPTNVGRRVPTKDDKLRLYIAGDSMAQGFGESLERLATQTGLVDATLDFKVSSGLTRPDFFDWPKRLSSQVAKLQPDVVVICFGGNDAQPIKAQNGKTYQVNDPEWKAEYERRVGAAMDFLGADGRKLIWVGTPNARSDDFNVRLQVLWSAVQDQATSHAGVSLINTWDMFSSPDGAYADYVVDETDHQAKLMRADDGYHLNFDGANKLARAIEAVVTDEIRARGGQVG